MKHTKKVSKTKNQSETTPEQADSGICTQILKDQGIAAYVDCKQDPPTPSDRRLKVRIQSLRGALAKLLRLRGVGFEYNEAAQDRGCPAGKQTGFVAQEVEQVIPEWVQVTDDGYRALAIKGFEGLAVEALRELKIETDQLRAELAGLKATVQELVEERQAAAF
jgi:endosialidase-like protein